MATTNTYHKPVLVNEVLHYLAPQPHKRYLDVTFGGGGHTRAILEAEPTCSVIALDWDMQAIEHNAPPLQEAFGDRLQVIWGNFALLYKILKKEKINTVDGILADFGTSQFQIFQRAGFSFQYDTPLDMRMSPAHQHLTAATILNEWPEQKIVHIFQEYGQEPKSRTLARAIVESRKRHPFKTTGDLVALVEYVIPLKPFKAQHGIHPATRIFQALRIAVNNELDNIQSFLSSAIRFINPGGRLVCISFHSLEDRLVKTFAKEHENELTNLTPKPITASAEEVAINPSARSAKLRAVEKK